MRCVLYLLAKSIAHSRTYQNVSDADLVRHKARVCRPQALALQPRVEVIAGLVDQHGYLHIRHGEFIAENSTLKAVMQGSRPPTTPTGGTIDSAHLPLPNTIS